MATNSLGVLLKNADILQRAAKLTGNFGELNDTILQILRDHLNKVEVRFAPKRPHVWDNHLAVLEVVYGGFTLKIPVPELKALDGEISMKVGIKMAKKFTNARALSMDGTKIWAPPSPGMIPYEDVGYHGGMYWAHEGATYDDFEEEGHLTVLHSLGWDEIEESGFPLREIVSREYDGFAMGCFYWLTQPPQNNKPKERLRGQLLAMDQDYAKWTSEKAVFEKAGHLLWTTMVSQDAWWTRVTVEWPDGSKKSYGFNHRDEAKGGDLFYVAEGWGGRRVYYRSIPEGGADVIRNDDYRMLGLFDGQLGEEENATGFVAAKAEYMGGEDGLDVVHAIQVTLTEVLGVIDSEHIVSQNRRGAEKLRTYLKSKAG